MSKGQEAFVKAHAVRWISDEPFPGVVEVELHDGQGKLWKFIDKYPMFLPKGNLSASSHYPISLNIA